MKVGIIGSGGREHAIMSCIKQSTKLKNILFPGNAGTHKLPKILRLILVILIKLKNFH